jgi:uncharacterized repeat protein (TIGR03806 family)
MRRLPQFFAIASMLFGCGSSTNDSTSTPSGERLSDLWFFADLVAERPAPETIAYDVVAALYADEAEKLRFLSIPRGKTAVYDSLGFWDYPDTTSFIKTFYFQRDVRDERLGRRLVETRVIRRDAGVWTGRTYVWNDAQTDAVHVKAGQTVAIQWVDRDGGDRTLDYRVPNENECKTCHSKDHVFEPLGPRTRQLNRDHDYGDANAPDLENQIDHLASLGLVSGDIPGAADRLTLVDPFGDGPLESRARSYLDANCSYCHRPGGEAGSSGLDLRLETVDPFSFGICRVPVAAGPGTGGRTYDIVPADPDASIMVFRISSTEPQLKMPEIPTLTADANGVALVRAWIAAMPSASCQ